MLFGIARNAYAKIRLGRIFQIFIQIHSVIHVVYLTDQIHSKSIPRRFRFKISLRFHSIATKRHHIINSQKTHVNQKVFCVFLCKSSAQYMGNGIYLILILNGGTNTYSSWTFAHNAFFQQPIGKLLIIVFFAMIGYINKGRLELHQGINAVKNRLDVLSL